METVQNENRLKDEQALAFLFDQCINGQMRLEVFQNKTKAESIKKWATFIATPHIGTLTPLFVLLSTLKDTTRKDNNERVETLVELIRDVLRSGMKNIDKETEQSALAAFAAPVLIPSENLPENLESDGEVLESEVSSCGLLINRLHHSGSRNSFILEEYAEALAGKESKITEKIKEMREIVESQFSDKTKCEIFIAIVGGAFGDLKKIVEGWPSRRLLCALFLCDKHSWRLACLIATSTKPRSFFVIFLDPIVNEIERLVKLKKNKTENQGQAKVLCEKVLEVFGFQVLNGAFDKNGDLVKRNLLELAVENDEQNHKKMAKCLIKKKPRDRFDELHIEETLSDYLSKRKTQLDFLLSKINAQLKGSLK